MSSYNPHLNFTITIPIWNPIKHVLPLELPFGHGHLKFNEVKPIVAWKVYKIGFGKPDEKSTKCLPGSGEQVRTKISQTHIAKKKNFTNTDHFFSNIQVKTRQTP